MLSSKQNVYIFSACGDGFTSRFGSPCLPCTENSYGKRCIRKCKCTKDEKLV